jgi:diacylglycerol kinase (ATP)
VTDPSRRIRVLWNPASGRKAGVRTNVELDEPAMRALLDRHGLGHDLVATSSAASAIAETRRAREDGVDVLVAAGGDGTVHVVARELLAGGGPVLGILPLGSVMNVARSLEIPLDIEAAARVIAQGHVRTVEVGLANDEPFFEAAVVGLHATVFREADRFDRGDRWALPRGIWRGLRYRPSRMRLELDDRTIRTRALVVSVANGPYAGMAFTVAPQARLDDGCLDVVVFERFSRLDLLRHFWSIAAGKRRYEPRVANYRARSVRITSARPLPTRADGQPLGTTPIEFRVLPDALRVLAPRPAPPHPAQEEGPASTAALAASSSGRGRMPAAGGPDREASQQ